MEIKKSQLKSKVRNFFTQKVRNIKENKRQQHIIETEGKILYSAVVLDEESRNKLLGLMKFWVDVPNEWRRLAHHMTISFKEELPNQLKKDLGEDITLKINSIGISDDAIAVGVDGYPSKNNTPHITVAIPPDGKPANSNFIEDWIDVDEEILLRGKVSEVRSK